MAKTTLPPSMGGGSSRSNAIWSRVKPPANTDPSTNLWQKEIDQSNPMARTVSEGERYSPRSKPSSGMPAARRCSAFTYGNTNNSDMPEGARMR
ncbi:hypothetical protein N9L68_01510 [bacterium]|nr:hypothetical protein [bacterium]